MTVIMTRMCKHSQRGQFKYLSGAQANMIYALLGLKGMPLACLMRVK